MSTKFYSFKTSDGKIEILTYQQASKLNDPLIKKRMEEIKDNTSNVKRVRDGFQSGWQENIGENCGDRKQYDNALKARGLVEIGKDYVPNGERNEISPCANEEFVQECLNQGVKLTGEEQSAIVSGDFFKD
jgi:hypothetical protein